MKTFFTYTDPVVPLHHPRVLIDAAMEQGAERQALLEGTGITEEMLQNPDARISHVQFAFLTANALTLTKNSSLGVDFGRHLHLSHMGMLGLAVLSSRTIGEALEIALKYYRTLAPGWDLSLQVDGPRASLVAREAIPMRPFEVFATEALLSAFDAQARHLYGRPVPLLELRLKYDKPAHASRLTELYDAPIYFNRETTEAIFDAAFLEVPLASADPLTMNMAERQCAAGITTSSPQGLTGKVKGLLAASLPPPDVRQIARALRTSTRSLRRGLQAMNTSYHVLLDATRREHAVAWTRSTEMTAEHMATQLGFADVRSFRRAFKRWTGTTVRRYRSGSTAPGSDGAPEE